jgi:glutamine amidotransferase
VRRAILKVIAWSRAAAPSEPPGLNVILSDGERMVGTRWGRSLYYLERRGLQPCNICGVPHIAHQPARAYRAVEVASEPITDEPWRAVAERILYTVSPDISLRFEPL